MEGIEMLLYRIELYVDLYREWLVWLPVFLLGIWFCWIVGVMLHIRSCRRRMDDYLKFVRETYVLLGERVPKLILRYLRKEVDTYNRARDRRGFRRLYRAVVLETLIRPGTEPDAKGTEPAAAEGAPEPEPTEPTPEQRLPAAGNDGAIPCEEEKESCNEE